LIKRVLLIDPPVTRPPDMGADKVRIGLVAPLGLASIAACLEAANIEVKIMDCVADGSLEGHVLPNGEIRYGLSDTQVMAELFKFQPDIVGVSCLFANNCSDAHNVCKIVKDYNKNVITIMGGAHPTALPLSTIADKNVDYVWQGEGEALAGMIVLMNLGHEAPRICPADVIENLDILPYPARHLLNMPKYLYSESPHSGLKRVPVANISTSRGCPGRCEFCAIRTLWGEAFRMRSPENVLGEIKLLIKQYGIKELHFEDDNFTASKKRAMAIFQGIIDNKWDLSLNSPSGLSVMALDEELLDKMKEAVLDMSKRTPVAVQELSGALYDIRSAGISASDAMMVLEQSAKLGVAGLGTTKEAADLATSAINSFELKGDDANKVFNTMQIAALVGKTTIAGLAQSFGMVAGTAKNANVSVEELMAATAALTTTGLSASVAQTQLRAAILAIQAPSKDMAELVKKAGYESGEAMIKQIGLVGSMNKMKEAAGGNIEVLKKAYGSVEALGSSLSLTGAQAVPYSAALKQMKTDTTALNTAFEKQNKQATAQYQILKNQLGVEMIKLGTIILPGLLKIVPLVSTGFKKFGDGFMWTADKLGSFIYQATRAYDWLVSVDKKVKSFEQGVVNKVKSFLPTFATGGVVPGSGPVPIVAHGGEMILNKDDIGEYFWAVTEAKNVEGSAVVKGSNFLTPVLSTEFIDENTIKVKCAISPASIVDSHKDVHIAGLWKKSLSESKYDLLLQEHDMDFNKVIVDSISGELEVYTEMISVKELLAKFKKTENKEEADIITSENKDEPTVVTQVKKQNVFIKI